MVRTAKLAVSWSIPTLTQPALRVRFVDPVGIGVARQTPRAPGILEIAHQLLLLGVDGDQRLARRLEVLDLRDDEAELGVPVGMRRPFARFGWLASCNRRQSKARPPIGD